jgi:hypothetical protein
MTAAVNGVGSFMRNTASCFVDAFSLVLFRVIVLGCWSDRYFSTTLRKSLPSDLVASPNPCHSAFGEGASQGRSTAHAHQFTPVPPKSLR